MTTRMIVLVCDRDDPKHGELTVLDDPRKAERLVETLLEAGFDQTRIRVFTGAEMDMQVTHRPVVALKGDEVVEHNPGDGSPAQEETEAEAEIEEPSRERAEEQEPEPATAYVRDGVRFSSLFRSA